MKAEELFKEVYMCDKHDDRIIFMLFDDLDQAVNHIISTSNTKDKRYGNIKYRIDNAMKKGYTAYGYSWRRIGLEKYKHLEGSLKYMALR